MPSARAATRSPLVLMADAHEWFSRALESVLVPGGYSVVKAYTATGLLQQLELTEPDALILAVDLPGGEGLNLCRMLRADSLVTPSTPIILTQPTPSTRRQTLAALRAGAAELWGQRLDAEELLLRLAALSARRRRRIGPGVEFLAGYDAVPDAAAPKFDPATLLAHASAALAAAARHPEAGRIRRFENAEART